MMTYDDLVSWWSVPIGTIYSWVARGEIPFVRLADRSVRFEREVLEAWLEERRSRPLKKRGKRGGSGRPA